MKEIKLCSLDTLEEKKPMEHQVNGLDLVVVRYGNKFNHNDLSTFDYDLHRLTGISYAGVSH